MFGSGLCLIRGLEGNPCYAGVPFSRRSWGLRFQSKHWFFDNFLHVYKAFWSHPANSCLPSCQLHLVPNKHISLFQSILAAVFVCFMTHWVKAMETMGMDVHLCTGACDPGSLLPETTPCPTAAPRLFTPSWAGSRGAQAPTPPMTEHSQPPWCADSVQAIPWAEFMCTMTIHFMPPHPTHILSTPSSTRTFLPTFYIYMLSLWMS